MSVAFWEGDGVEEEGEGGVRADITVDSCCMISKSTEKELQSLYRSLKSGKVIEFEMKISGPGKVIEFSFEPKVVEKWLNCNV